MGLEVYEEVDWKLTIEGKPEPLSIFGKCVHFLTDTQIKPQGILYADLPAGHLVLSSIARW